MTLSTVINGTVIGAFLFLAVLLAPVGAHTQHSQIHPGK